MAPPRRIDKYLRDCTHRPLAILRVACVEGRVTIVVPASLERPTACSRVVTQQDELVYDGDWVELDGKPVMPRPSKDYLALNKPCGITSSASDPDGFEDLSAWLRVMPEGVFPVGRLDRMTSGLLLFTNDGDFAHALLHPEHHVTKHYRLCVRGRVEPTDPRVRLLVQGVEHPGHASALRASSASVVNTTRTGFTEHRGHLETSENHAVLKRGWSPTQALESILQRGTPAQHSTKQVHESASGDTTELWLSLNEGKHRQIRKMCHTLKFALTDLHRHGIGSVELGALEPGATRRLTNAEVDTLWTEAGGRESILRRQLDALVRRAAAARKAGAPLLRLEEWLGSV